jgi:hypothetical protein
VIDDDHIELCLIYKRSENEESPEDRNREVVQRRFSASIRGFMKAVSTSN